MKPKKRRLLGSTAFILAFTACMAACSSDKENTDASNETPKPTTEAVKAVDHAQQAKIKFDPPVTITTALVQEQLDNAFKTGETIEDNVFTRWMKDNMGIQVKFDFIVGKQTDFDTKLRLLLASDEKLPDVFTGSFAADLIDAGKLLPLNDAIEQYASPNLKQLFAQYPQAFESVTRDGIIYGIPRFLSADEGGVMWIREDWLKRLNLTAPTTIVEFEKLLEAFTNQDPDGNGKPDTFGLAVSLKDGMYTWMASADPIFGAFSDYMAPEFRSITQFWNPDANGKLVYGAVDPSAKPFLETMARWKNSGYIDPEAGVKDAMKAVEPAVQGNAGVLFGPNWMGQWPLEDTAKSNPDAVWKAYPIPAGPEGKIGRVVNLTGGSLVFSKDFKHIDAWFAYLNKMYARQFGNTDPYYDPTFEAGFFEGYDYVNHNGKTIKNGFKESGVPQDKWPLASGKTMDMKYALYALHGAFAPTVPYLGDPGYKKFADDPNALAANSAEERVKSLTKSQLEAGNVRQTQSSADKFNSFQGAPSETMQSKGALLNKLESEAYLKIIYGEKPVDYFDEFVKEWRASGGDQVISDANAWYESTKKK
ncbi:extracellular solute-binding protein [Paenibacillus pasadenensis]|uniref:extracellular solute-binding protein n=1 Tax=Paenibacillus pasadenensis TaxID=217090 RepID=UPI00203E0032|nr:extracellular solute-binding protein [Paenibacillus pasadenensis]MCM3746601.1 extracellular solute-binding protein [Paenibacillus pasadenensis]